MKNATARNGQRHSKERPTPQQGTANATARNCRCHSKELPMPRVAFGGLLC
ncbi:MAG: hypothetical protein IJT11_10840 [Bacteroidaceae bacterium]|nr:hypothetical protein [Bacteroidaceae bacterium]